MTASSTPFAPPRRPPFHGLTVFVFAVCGWRPGPEWAMVGAGLLTITVADSIYLMLSAAGHYQEGTVLDALWPTGLLLLAAAAWRPLERVESVELEGRFLGAVPIGCGFVALGVLLYGYLKHQLDGLAVALSVATIVTVFIRMALSFSDNARLLEWTRRQSLTDALTGLGNRRKLMLDLESKLGSKDNGRALLVILDLNGFKGYNDRFGHPSGDALLARLAANLDDTFRGHGSTYRLGGDEFCVYAPIRTTDAETLIDTALQALSEAGEGFSITASCGASLLPDDATNASDAMQIADQRLYAHKADQYRSKGDSFEVLKRALDEREPGFRQHLHDVAELATGLGERLGLTGQELTQLRLAAELHDVGKLAIPDAILRKPSALSSSEWEFIRRHTTIGQRILGGSPALHQIGDIVRSTHERWDGTGYPDGLSGEAIPRAARIIAICDAYSAMVTDRPYRAARPRQAALGELRRCAGSQFDPSLVADFCLMTATDSPSDAEPAPKTASFPPW